MVQVSRQGQGYANTPGIHRDDQVEAWRHVTGAGALAGMGFTMSLLITDLAFADPALRDAAKVAVLFSCVATSVPGALILRSARPGGGGG